MTKSVNRCMTQINLPAMLYFAAFLICVYGAPRDAWARAGGISGYSGSGSTCTSCHSGGAIPTVSLTGPATLAVGTSGVYTLKITGGAAGVGGLDVSISGGTLQATGPNTKLLNGEIVQSAATSFTGGSLSYTFTVVAPSAAGSIILYASGLSANRNSSTSGDNSAKTWIGVTVTSTTYNVTPSSGANGSMVCTPTTVSAGGSFTCSLSPATGYHLSSLLDNTVDVTSQVANGQYSVINVTANHVISAAFSNTLPVLRLWGTNNRTSYSTIQDAYNNALNNDSILTQAGDFTENLALNRGLTLSISGGYNADFSAVTGVTAVHGSMSVEPGSVSLRNLILQSTTH